MKTADSALSINTTGKIIIAIVLIAFAISIGYGAYLQWFKSKPIILPSVTTQVAETPKEVKKVKKVKKPVNIQLYDNTELQKKFKFDDLKPSEGVGAIGINKTEIGKTYTRSVIDTETGENKLLQTEVRDKFRFMFDPAIYLKIKGIGSNNADIGRLGTEINFIRINGNVDINATAEVFVRNDKETKGYQRGWVIFGGMTWHPLK